MRYETIAVQAPTVEPVTLAEAKLQLRLTDLFVADDPYITSLIPAARDRAERYCNRFFSSQVVKLVVKDGFPTGSFFEIPFPDVTSIDSIFYIDSSGTSTEITGFSFLSDSRTIFNAEGWPTDVQSMTVTMTVEPPVVYDSVRQAILMMITDMYELRTESVVGASVAENKAVKALLYPYRFNLGIA